MLILSGSKTLVVAEVEVGTMVVEVVEVVETLGVMAGDGDGEVKVEVEEEEAAVEVVGVAEVVMVAAAAGVAVLIGAAREAAKTRLVVVVVGTIGVMEEEITTTYVGGNVSEVGAVVVVAAVA